MKLGLLLAELLVVTNQKLGIEDTNAAGVCLSMASRVDPEGKLVLGALLQMAKSEDAIGHYRGYFMNNPISYQLWNNLGVLSFEKNKKLAAIASFRRAAYLNPLDSVGIMS